MVETALETTILTEMLDGAYNVHIYIYIHVHMRSILWILTGVDKVPNVKCRSHMYTFSETLPGT